MSAPPEAGVAARDNRSLRAEERELTLAFQRGDVSAYDVIYERYSPRVGAVCGRLLGNHSDAQEACQETFLRVYQALGKFNGRYQLGAWIARIATNVCLDHLRARSRRPADVTPLEAFDLEPLNGHGNGDSDPEAFVVRKAETRRVRRVLGSLPPMHRAAIVLRDFEGLSYGEVACALDITETQVKALIHRARNNFKRSWNGSGLAVLLPWRWVSRVDAPGKEQTSQAMASGGQFATQCSVVLQQCGQFVGERLAPVVVAAAVGTSSVAAALASGPPDLPPPPPATSGGNDDRVLALGTGDDDEKDGPARTAVRSDPVLPSPTPSPTPSPSASPSDSTTGTGGTSGSGSTSGSTSPSPSPSQSSPPSEPAGFAGSFAHDEPSRATPCECLWSAHVTSESGRGDEGGLYSFNQSFRGTAAAAGERAYGLEARHSTSHADGHDMTFTLWTAAGSYMYRASGAVAERRQNGWGGWVYSYSGNYQWTSRPGTAEEMPRRGTYRATVVFSWRQQRIVSTSISLTEG